MPFILRAEQLGAWLGDDWLQILANPDRTLLEKIQTQAELFLMVAVRKDLFALAARRAEKENLQLARI
jgi:hypothetical protein